MDNQLIDAGIIVNTHGVRGMVKIQPWADTPGFLTGFDEYYIDGAPVKVLSARVHKGCVIAALSGVEGIDASIRLKNKTISVLRCKAGLEEGRYFITDVIGLRAICYDTGKELGIVEDILSLPANNVYIIKGAREILVPAVPEFIKETDLTGGIIKVKLIDGM